MEGEIMDKSIVEINCKSKNILQLWNWIYQLNKKKRKFAQERGMVNE